MELEPDSEKGLQDLYEKILFPELSRSGQTPQCLLCLKRFGNGIRRAESHVIPEKWYKHVFGNEFLVSPFLPQCKAGAVTKKLLCTCTEKKRQEGTTTCENHIERFGETPFCLAFLNSNGKGLAILERLMETEGKILENVRYGSYLYHVVSSVAFRFLLQDALAAPYPFWGDRFQGQLLSDIWKLFFALRRESLRTECSGELYICLMVSADGLEARSRFLSKKSRGSWKDSRLGGCHAALMVQGLPTLSLGGNFVLCPKPGSWKSFGDPWIRVSVGGLFCFVSLGNKLSQKLSDHCQKVDPKGGEFPRIQAIDIEKVLPDFVLANFHEEDERTERDFLNSPYHGISKFPDSHDKRDFCPIRVLLDGWYESFRITETRLGVELVKPPFKLEEEAKLYIFGDWPWETELKETIPGAIETILWLFYFNGHPNTPNTNTFWWIFCHKFEKRGRLVHGFTTSISPTKLRRLSVGDIARSELKTLTPRGQEPCVSLEKAAKWIHMCAKKFGERCQTTRCPNGGIRACSCQRAVYCSVACQKADHHTHKRVCKWQRSL
jgi:hypothetical protein